MSHATGTPTKAFASQADLEVKKVSFTKLSDNAYAYTAEGDPNTGIIIGDDAVMVIDTQATPVMAQDVIRHIRTVTDKPIKHVVLSHYHAVRVLGASGYNPEHIIASRDTYDLIVERGEQDKASEIGRFPRLFQAVESVPPGMTWPTITFQGRMSIWLGQLEVQLIQLGRGHTKGDTVVWIPSQKILFSGDLVEFDATPYAGDAYFQDWPQTLDNIAAMQPLALVPGRGAALTTPEAVAAGLAGTRSFIQDVWTQVQAGVAAGKDLNQTYKDTMAALSPKYGHWVIFQHCMPFDVTRCYDEASGHADPRIWTAERDVAMWQALES
ncbi:MAG: MBL fold metallo-hydrolase [Burkholderiales bacterium PBB5]|nr:MAG: MBL fold metallo-hydrolase [Burkholderiales bacterium PBB5]